MGGVLPYKREAYCRTNGRRTAGFPFLRSLEARKVRRYKWGAYCRTNWRCTAVLSSRPVGVGVSETVPNYPRPNCLLNASQTQQNSRRLWRSRRRRSSSVPEGGVDFQQPFSLPESARTLAGIAFQAAGKSGNHFPAASKFAGKPFQQGISDSHSLLEFSDKLSLAHKGGLFFPLSKKSNPTIRAPPRQKPCSISSVQSWGWCIFCSSLRFWQFVHPPLEIPSLRLEVLCGGGICLVVS